MERTRTVEPKEPLTPEVKEVVAPRPMLKYKVLAGTLRIFGKTYKKNEAFVAYPEQIPDAFKKNLACISDPALQAVSMEDHQKLLPKEDIFEVVPALAKGWYNVVNLKTKKPINEKSLRHPDAEKLKEALNS